MPQHLARIVDLRAREPDRTRHLALCQHGAVRRRRSQVEIIPDALPERIELANRPLPHRFIVLEVQVALLAEPLAITRHLRDGRCCHDLFYSCCAPVAAAVQAPAFNIQESTGNVMAGWRKRAMQIGELFILGFFGKTIPAWLREFAERYGLGGVILFDYSWQTQKYDNNIESPEQVRRLCSEISRLPSSPMVFIDQEGGLVRRLKDSRGFKPLPSAREFNHLTSKE